MEIIAVPIGPEDEIDVIRAPKAKRAAARARSEEDDCDASSLDRKFVFAPKCRGTTAKRSVLGSVAPTQQTVWRDGKAMQEHA